jgi:dTDP-4-dehydrorhamnose reductase
MRILLFGGLGQLGWELNRVLRPLGGVAIYDHPEVDFTHPEQLAPLVAASHADVIVNAIAYTNVDQAESEPEKARLVNGVSTGVLAEAARKAGAALIHYSTDYVFDGKKGRPYGERDVPAPLNVYGQSKLLGEQAIAGVGGAWIVIRTSWVYSLRPGSFVTKVLQWSRKQPVLRLVTDQVGSPTWARALAETTGQLLARAGQEPQEFLGERKGIYHLAGLGQASRLEWGKAILSEDPRPQEQMARELLPALTAEFPTPAERPLYSALDCTLFEQTFQLQLPPWQEALHLAMQS